MGADAGMRNLIAMVAIGLSLTACTGSSGPNGGSDTTGHGRSRGYYKVGAPYQINGVWYHPRVDYAYDETGTASWYGEAFNGKSTANGEIFDLTQVSAAHKTLQLPSIVEVTNLQNGRALKVRVNDRGPFAGDRIIDLSRRAAQLLGFERAGTAPVRVRIIKEESIKVAEAAMRGDIGQIRLAQDTAIVQTRVAAAPPRTAVLVASAPARIVKAEATEAAPIPGPAVSMAAERPPPTRRPQQSLRSGVRRRHPSQPAYDAAGRRSAWPSLIASARAATSKAVVAPRQETPADPPSGRIFVQVGMFALAANAKSVRARVATLAGTEVVRVNVNGSALYRVRLGPVASEAEARRLLGELDERGIRERPHRR